jgi:hypothetical protein
VKRICPTLKALHENALRNPDLCGVLADWYEEYGQPCATSLARRGEIHRALTAFENDYARWPASQVEFSRTIRGVEVQVFADSFEGDDETGIPYGPEEVWAETLDGEPFELTDEEAEFLGMAATDMYLGDDFL